VSAPDAALDSRRREVAAARGLGADAATFLTGSTLDELEAHADAFAKVLGTSDEGARTSRGA
jgi:hypothetical protein